MNPPRPQESAARLTYVKHEINRNSSDPGFASEAPPAVSLSVSEVCSTGERTWPPTQEMPLRPGVEVAGARVTTRRSVGEGYRCGLGC